MTRLRNIALGGLAALAVTAVASTAFAEEPASFYNRLNGATVGLPLGAAPPPGLYTGLETAYLGWPGHGTGNQAPGLSVPAIAQAVPLLFVPGWNFLGASYSMSAVVAFYEAQVLAPGITPFGSAPLSTAANVYVFANPLWNPINLSWNMGNGWFVSAGFNFVAPIGTNASNATNPDYWTFEPTFAVSYLANNWVLSANFFYDINTQSKGTCCAGDSTYTSGNILDIDMMAAYKFGKWEVGPVAYIEEQTTADTTSLVGGCGTALGSLYCGNAQNFAIGGLIGYDFGPVDLQVWATDSVWRDNQIDGFDIWTRLGFRLWAPEAAKPMVAKD